MQTLHRTMSQHMRYLSPFLFADVWSECTEFIVSWFVFLESVLKADPEYSETVACFAGRTARYVYQVEWC